MKDRCVRKVKKLKSIRVERMNFKKFKGKYFAIYVISNSICTYKMTEYLNFSTLSLFNFDRKGKAIWI